MIAYRICERNKNGDLLTLFHGIKGSRKMPLGVWMDADIKRVRDGDPKRAKEYTSGFHCLSDIGECRAFIKHFRAPRDLVLVECEVDGIRHKTHSRSNVLLTDRMKLVRVVEDLKIKQK